MDVYKYIKSKDIREYNKKLGTKFNALESAWFVWRNPDISLYKKHKGFRDIIKNFSDTEVQKTTLSA